MEITNVQEMEKAIKYLNELTYWYDLGKPLVSDLEYDNLYFKLQDAEQKLGIVLEDSPTAKITYEIKNELTKVTHNHPMLSAAKTKDENEFLDYFNSKSFITMLKMDGLTCSLRYVNHKLVSAETRGDGMIGEDITHNILTLSSVPKTIDYEDELIIDGEIICKYDDFTYFENDYANPRNFASGSIRLLDANECAKRKLTFVAWNVIKGFPNIFTAHEKLDYLAKLNFTVVPYVFGFNKQELVDKAKELNYPIDGLVGRFDDISYGESLGSTGHHSKAIFAFKFYDDEYETTLTDVIWQVGRTGILTPVAVFEPVYTSDSTVDRATLHNLSVAREILGPVMWVGQKIRVAKQNDIIPAVIWAEKNPIDKSVEIKMPTVCPECGHPITIKNNNRVLTAWCENNDCIGKSLNKIVYYCSKNGLDIKGLSEHTILKLMQWGWLNEVKDLYNLESYKTQWSQKSGFGAKSVNKILDSIKNNSIISEPWRFISAIGIPLIGVNNAKELANKFTIDEFITNAKEGYDFSSLFGFGFEMNKSIQDFDYTWVEELLDNGYVTIVEQKSDENKSNSCNNLKFVITGSVNNFKNREELKSKIESLGGKVNSSISASTNYLINNDINSTSNKNKKAKELGIPIITEQDFIDKFLS